MKFMDRLHSMSLVHWISFFFFLEYFKLPFVAYMSCFCCSEWLATPQSAQHTSPHHFKESDTVPQVMIVHFVNSMINFVQYSARGPNWYLHNGKCSVSCHSWFICLSPTVRTVKLFWLILTNVNNSVKLWLVFTEFISLKASTHLWIKLVPAN